MYIWTARTIDETNDQPLQDDDKPHRYLQWVLNKLHTIFEYPWNKPARCSTKYKPKTIGRKEIQNYFPGRYRKHTRMIGAHSAIITPILFLAAERRQSHDIYR